MVFLTTSWLSSWLQRVSPVERRRSCDNGCVPTPRDNKPPHSLSRYSIGLLWDILWSSTRRHLSIEGVHLFQITTWQRNRLCKSPKVVASAWDIMVLSSRSMTVFLKVENVVVLFVERPSIEGSAVIQPPPPSHPILWRNICIAMACYQQRTGLLQRKTDLVQDTIELGTLCDFFTVVTVQNIK